MMNMIIICWKWRFTSNNSNQNNSDYIYNRINKDRKNNAKPTSFIYMFWENPHPMFPKTSKRQKIEAIASLLNQLVCHWDKDFNAFFLFARWKKDDINPTVEKANPQTEKIIRSNTLIAFKNCSSPRIDMSPKPNPERTVKRIIDGAGCITTY